jgi:hypothetical protein
MALKIQHELRRMWRSRDTFVDTNFIQVRCCVILLQPPAATMAHARALARFIVDLRGCTNESSVERTLPTWRTD